MEFEGREWRRRKKSGETSNNNGASKNGKISTASYRLRQRGEAERGRTEERVGRVLLVINEMH